MGYWYIPKEWFLFGLAGISNEFGLTAVGFIFVVVILAWGTIGYYESRT